MNNKTKNIQLTKNAKVYFMSGYYDESGRYHEVPFEKVALRKFPNNVRRDLISNLNRGYDFNALIFPQFRSIYAFLPVEYEKDFERHIGAEELKALLDTNADYVVPHGHLFWAGRAFPKD